MMRNSLVLNLKGVPHLLIFQFFVPFVVSLTRNLPRKPKNIFMLGSTRDSAKKQKEKKFDARFEIISPPFNFKVDLVTSKYCFYSILNPSQCLSCSKTLPKLG